MEWYFILLIILGGLLFVFLFFFLIPVIFISRYVYRKQLVRTSPEKWGRECSAKDNEEQVRMFDIGTKWGEENKEYAIDVEIENEGLKLVGRYFDFGFKKACIILAGRTESFLYSYYFAKPYKELGYNILVIDSRGHGYSEGIYLGVGLKEYKDALKWCSLLHDKYNNESIFIHAICIGCATAVYMLTSKDCPSYFEGMVAEGMYTTFYETFKEHMIYEKKPVWPCAWIVMQMLKSKIKADPIKNGPIYCIDKLNKPILMLHSRLDKFSLPDKAQILYDKCNSPKKLVWFDKGAHSHIRINNTEKYDNEIKEFIKEYINK